MLCISFVTWNGAFTFFLPTLKTLNSLMSVIPNRTRTCTTFLQSTLNQTSFFPSSGTSCTSNPTNHPPGTFIVLDVPWKSMLSQSPPCSVLLPLPSMQAVPSTPIATMLYFSFDTWSGIFLLAPFRLVSTTCSFSLTLTQTPIFQASTTYTFSLTQTLTLMALTLMSRTVLCFPQSGCECENNFFVFFEGK